MLFLIGTTTVACIVLAIPAGPLSHLITSEHVPGAFRVSVLGIWSFTNLELAQAVLRVDERLKAYAIAGTTNVLVTVAASVVLVVGLNKGYIGLLIANYGTSTLVLFGLWWDLRQAAAASAAEWPRASARSSASACRPCPAEASVYALSVLDRQYIIHNQGAAAAGRYAIAIKVAECDRVHRHRLSVRLAAARLLGQRRRAGGAAVRAGHDLLRADHRLGRGRAHARGPLHHPLPRPARGLLRGLQGDPVGLARLGDVRAVGGPAGDRRARAGDQPQLPGGVGRASSSTCCCWSLLVPRYGIAGAGVALCGAYAAMLTVMHLLVRRAFPVTFEWRRLGQLVLVLGGLAVAGELLLPESGFVGFVARAARVRGDAAGAVADRVPAPRRARPGPGACCARAARG